jgi:hypothetical protein
VRGGVCPHARLLSPALDHLSVELGDYT